MNLKPRDLSEWIDTFGGDTCRVKQALAMETKLAAIQKIVDDYLLHGEGGGGRHICIKIQQTLTGESAES